MNPMTAYFIVLAALAIGIMIGDFTKGGEKNE